MRTHLPQLQLDYEKSIEEPAHLFTWSLSSPLLNTRVSYIITREVCMYLHAYYYILTLQTDCWYFTHGIAALASILGRSFYCSLVTCNEFDGFLTKDRNGSEPITGPDDPLLAHGIYFFHVRWPQPDIYKYPIYSSFRNWTYPHVKAPNSWVGSWTTTTAPRVPGGATNSTTSPIVISRNGKRCVSCVDALERAYLSPQAEKDWFQLNSMQEYNANISLSIIDIGLMTKWIR